MIHNMKLWPDSFEAIKNKTKTVEMRLNDEKRSIIKKGDIIVFSNTKTKEEIKVDVINRNVYKDFNELYKAYDKLSIGYLDNEVASPNDMEMYYKKEDIEKYGALAIVIKVIE
ncbi:MAG: DUF3850 domain-containing protein [Acholeplasmatales bacterium]|nr:DUF3850 domain-containing protein [Acholeplasmatales bacterium]